MQFLKIYFFGFKTVTLLANNQPWTVLQFAEHHRRLHHRTSGQHKFSAGCNFFVVSCRHRLVFCHLVMVLTILLSIVIFHANLWPIDAIA